MRLSLEAKIRKEKAKKIRKERKIPAVLYGPKIKNLNLEIDEKEFEKILKETGEISLINLKVQDQKGKKKNYLVLIHDFQKDPLNDKIIHVDFFQPSLKEKIDSKVPINFEGEAPAVKLGGTFVKIISEIEVRATPENLPKEIKVNISKLKSFEDAIFVSDLNFPKGVEVLREKNDVIARVLPLEKVEEIPKTVEQPSTEEPSLTEKKE